MSFATVDDDDPRRWENHARWRRFCCLNHALAAPVAPATMSERTHTKTHTIATRFAIYAAGGQMGAEKRACAAGNRAGVGNLAF